jgi:hypothetical protein
MNNSEVRRCESIRVNAYNDLCHGARNNDQKLIDSAMNRMSVCGSRRDQVGFTTADILDHYNRVDEKLNHFNGMLQHKQQLLQSYFRTVSDSNGADNTKASQRVSLSRDIHELGDSVRILSRIFSVLTELLRRRGELVSAMTEERSAVTSVTVC